MNFPGGSIHKFRDNIVLLILQCQAWNQANWNKYDPISFNQEGFISDFKRYLPPQAIDMPSLTHEILGI